MRKSYLSALLLAGLVTFVGCGGGNSSNDSNTPNNQNEVVKKKAIFYDDVVVGLTVAQDNGHGLTLTTTSSIGEFEYDVKKPVTFKAGSVTLGTIKNIPQDNKVFLSDLYGLKRGTLNDKRIEKAAILLQSLDTTTNDNKIVLNKNELSKLPQGDIASNSFDINSTLSKAGKTPISKEKALQAVQNTYKSQGVKTDEPSGGDEITKKCQAKTLELSKFNKGKWTQQDYNEYETFFIANSNNENIYCKAGLGRLYLLQKKTNYEEIYSLIEPAAKAGFAPSQHNFGFRYYSGQGVTKDYKKALEWYTKAANQGYVNSQMVLGIMYYNGDGITKDYKKALEWFTKAANQGNAEGQNNLGVMYYNGQGTTKDSKKALEWYTKAANQGHVKAQNSLGIMYYNGEGTTKDYKKALEWFIKAANQGDANSQSYLGVMYYNGLGTTKDTSKACKWLSEAKKQGDKTAEDNYNKVCK